MRESFSKPIPKQEVEQEIRSGLEEYLRKKLSENKEQSEIIAYDTETANRPLSRVEVEQAINNFIDKNLNILISLVYQEEDSTGLNKFKLLNRDLRNFGFGDTSIIVEAILPDQENYRILSIPEEYGARGYSDRLNYPIELDYDRLNSLDIRVRYPDIDDGYEKYRRLSEVIATAYLKEEIQIDSKLKGGNHNSYHPRRYLHKNIGRYLCENDFGMKPYGSQAEVSDISPFAETVKRQVRKVLSNIETIKEIISSNIDFYTNEVRTKLEKEHPLPKWPKADDPNREQLVREYHEARALIQEKVQDESEKHLTELFALPTRDKAEESPQQVRNDFFSSPNIKNLIFNAVPWAKFCHELESKPNKNIQTFIDEELKSDTDPHKKLKFYQSPAFLDGVRERIFQDFEMIPQLGEIAAISTAHNKPVILGREDNTPNILDSLSKRLMESYIVSAKNEIISSYPDPRMEQIIRNTCDGWSKSGATRYGPDDLDFYNALDHLGIDKFLELYPEIQNRVLERNSSYENLGISQTVHEVLGLYSIFGKGLKRLETDKLRKEMWHYRSLDDAGIWNYFYQIYQSTLDTKQGNHIDEDTPKVGNVLDALPQTEKKKIFFEGKQMYWLAKQVQRKIWELEKNKNIQAADERDEDKEQSEFKFHEQHRNINWEQYDCQNIDVKKLSQYLSTHGNLICAFLAHNKDQDSDSQVNIGTAMKVIEAVEAGVDIRGVALAFDKQKYLAGLLSGEEKNDLEYALRDWPAELRSAVSSEEIQVYFDNAEQYLYQDPSGLVRYAKLMQKEKLMRDLLKNEIDQKSDLDLRLCLSVQTAEVRGWYIEGAEYIGHDAMQKYFVRFEATKEQTGGYSDLHDALFWIPNIKKVAPDEAKSLLNSINTVDESNELRNFLPRYNKEKDPLTDSGLIQSIRELKKRVFALESKIDLSGLPPEILDIVSAPGFNLSYLETLKQQTRFTELTEGKLDKEQPFNPHKRKFTARPLSELLKSGLGSFKEKIPGTAQDPKGLFSDVRKLMQGHEVAGRPMQIQDLLKEVPINMEEDILKALQAQRVATGIILEATVHPKSDPEGWVCGNYTDCCMPFGSDINTDYMFNKATQYFTVKYNDRIIAQSVVVDAINKETGESVVVLDNIEIAKNYQNRSALLSRIYKTFWTEYTSKPVKIGTGYSDLTPDNAKLEENIYSPKYSLSYSDSKDSHIYDLPKIKDVEPLDKILTFSSLTERDAETIAEMEKASYPEEFIQGKGQILDIVKRQRALEIPGAASSFMVRQGEEPAGYLLVLPEPSRLNEEEMVAHIYDMAVLPKFRGGIAARRMMERLLDTARTYDVPAIEFEARESTSYRLVTNPRIAKWIESKGYKLTYDEPMPEYMGGEDFHFVRLEKVAEQS